MEASSAEKAMSSSAGSAKSPVHVRIRRNKAFHLEVEGKPVAFGFPKCQAAGKVSQNFKGMGKQRKRNTPPDISPPILSEVDLSLSGTTFPVGPCVGSQLELRNHT
jgi:hypothetical protein